VNIISKIKGNKLEVPIALGKLATVLAETRSNEGKMVMFSVRIIKDKRSLLQNNYYWALMDIIGNETGYTPGEAHAYCKAQFLKLVPGVQIDSIPVMDIKADVMTVDGEPGDLSTTRLNTKQFTDYIELIRTFFRESMDIILPTPDRWEAMIS